MGWGMTGQTPAGGKGSNKGPLGCVLAVVLLFGGCVAYAEAKGNVPDNSQAAGNPPAAAAQQPAASPSPSLPPPAQMLADLDGDTQPASDYQAALDALAPKCTEDETFIAGLGNSGYDDLAKNGIHDETRLTVLQHLNESIPDGLGKTDCGQMLAAYLVLREPN